jgi:hypothetical protein
MADPIDLDPLSPLVQRAKFNLMGKSRSYVQDSRDFARAVLSASEQLETLRAENDRLVREYAEALTALNGAPRGNA